MEAETITDTQSEVKTKAFLNSLPYILAYVESEALVDTVIVTLTIVKAEKLSNSGRVGS